VDSSGKETPLEEGPTPRPVYASRISLDGQRILFTYGYPGMQAEFLDLARQARRRVTFGANPTWAIWGPGPDRVTFMSDHEGPQALYARRMDAGPEEIETLWKPPDAGYLSVGSWSHDGKVLAFTRSSEAKSNDIWLLESGKTPRPFVASKFDEMWPDISPDGEWLLYTSDGPGHPEVFARSLSGQGNTLQVSAGEGQEPLWSRDGASAFYWQPVEAKPGHRVLFRVRVTRVTDSVAFGVPERLFEGSYYAAYPGHSWDVGPDGRFLVLKAGNEEATRAYFDKILSNRIVIETGGVARLLAEPKAGP
jgi:Tol biopolymer transport system component